MSLQILVVDDDSFMRKTVVSMAAKLGWNAQEATSVKDALSLPNLPQFDLIVSDVQMPQANGTELIVTLQNRSIQIPFIFMSGSFQYDDSWAVRQNAQAFLSSSGLCILVKAPPP